MPRLTILLPCFNEQQALPALLQRLELLRNQLLPDWHAEALVVDDGSTDTTADVALAGCGDLPLTLVRHEHNLGLGSALRTGIQQFISRAGAGPERAVLAVMDADGTHPPELLPRMLQRLGGEPSEDACDVVIASRYAPGGEEHGLPWLRWLYSRLASAVLRLVARTPGVLDYTCGFRVYRREILAAAIGRFGSALITENSFVCMAELLIKLGRRGARIGEVPLRLHYELKGGPSKMNVAATIRRYVVLVRNVLFDPSYK